MNREEEKALTRHCIDLFNDKLTKSVLPKLYSGVYEWGKDINPGRRLKAMQLVRVVTSLTSRPGWGATRFQSYAGDMGIIVGRCERIQNVSVWLVQFADGVIGPFPYNRLLPASSCSGWEPMEGTSAHTFLDNYYSAPAPAKQEFDKEAKVPCQAEIDAYVDPFEAGSAN